MTDPARISELMLENLFAVFNVRDPERRREAIARNYTEDVTWTDPDGTSQGVRRSTNERRSCSIAYPASSSPSRGRSA